MKKLGKLERLIASLSKNEKAYFKRWLPSTDKQTKFLLVFQLIEKNTGISTAQLIAGLEMKVTAKKLNTLKAHLWSMLLLSLRDYHRKSERPIQLNSRLDGIKVLQSKGLLDVALKDAEKLLLECEKIENFSGALCALEHIESIRVTKVEFNKEKDQIWKELYLKKESISSNLVEISQMRGIERELIQLNSKLGVSIPTKEHELLVTEVLKRLSDFSVSDSSCFDVRFRYYQTRAIISRILVNHNEERKWFEHVLNLLNENPLLSETYYVGFYAVALHNYINACILSHKYNLVPDLLDRLKAEPAPDAAAAFRNFYFRAYDSLVFRTITEDYRIGYQQWLEFKKQLQTYPPLWEDGDIRLNVHGAVLCFWSTEYKQALSTLRELFKRVTNSQDNEILRMARMLEVICNYQLGDYDHAEYLIGALQRKWEENENALMEKRVVQAVLDTITKDDDSVWKDLLINLNSLTKTPNEQFKLLTFDVVKFVKSLQK